MVIWEIISKTLEYSKQIVGGQEFYSWPFSIGLKLSVYDC